MENTTQLVLSDYQKAILTEMGISSWQLVDEVNIQAKGAKQTLEAVAISSEPRPKEDALAKLKQLKVQTQKSVSTDSVLVAFSPGETKYQIFTDVLIALELDTNPQKHIPISDLSHYVEYPLSWIQGEKVNVYKKQLTTPPLPKLHQSEIKKQLWLQLQNASFFEKSN